MHLDGARLWNAIVATGIAASEWKGLAIFDTISVCFSKGLGFADRIGVVRAA